MAKRKVPQEALERSPAAMFLYDVLANARRSIGAQNTPEGLREAIGNEIGRNDERY